MRMITAHDPYTHILAYLAERHATSDLPSLLERLAPFGYAFWQALQESPESADYGAPENQAYYLLRIFPHHIEQLYRTLTELPEAVRSAAFGIQTLQVCFFGAGPAPEVIGLLMYLRDHAPQIRTVHATLLDKYTESWSDIQQNLLQRRLAPAYWSGRLHLSAYPLDNQDRLTWDALPEGVQTAISQANVLVFQNCLSDLRYPDQFLRNFELILREAPQNAVIVFNDLNYHKVHELLRRIEQYATESTFGRLILSQRDGLIVHCSNLVSNTLVDQYYFGRLTGLTKRHRTQYYRSVILKSTKRVKTDRLTPAEMPILPLAGGALAQAALEAQPDLFGTLETLLSPGRQMRLSPYIQNVQSVYLWGEVVAAEQKEQDWRRLAQAHHDDLEIWANALRAYWQDGYRRVGLYTGEPNLQKAGLIAHATWHIPQVQRVLLDLFEQRDLPSTLSVLICSETPSLELIALLDFLIALQDVCDLFSTDYQVPALHVVCLTPYPNDLDQTLFEHYLNQVEPVYAERLPLTDLVWRTAQPETWVSDLRNQSFTLAFIRDSFAHPNWLEPLEAVLCGALANSVTLFFESAQNASALFQWRYAFIKQHPRFRSLAPCGAEYGNQLPQCSACVSSPIWRAEQLHIPPLYRYFEDAYRKQTDQSLDEAFSKWSYTVLYGGSSTQTLWRPETITFGERNRFEAPVLMRYLGKFTPQKGRLALDHPDRDDQIRHLYHRVCPGHTNASKLAIYHEAGKEFPRLRFGQAFKLSDCIVEPYGSEGNFRIRLTENTKYELSQAHSNSFLPQYTALTQQAVNRVAHRLFGFKAMREFQHAILEQVLCGNSVLGIAATGGGKSECYILPAMVLSGITVVVSPLKSLMQDQIDQRLRDRYGLDYLCTFINGDVPMKERQHRLQRLENGYYKLVFVTPEQLERSYILESLQRAHRHIGIRYVALDEAHCISQWGHDFRPAYLNIVTRLKQYGIYPVRIALTATASPKVREDLCRELDLKPGSPAKGGNVLIFSSNRAELNLIVRVASNTNEKVEFILEALEQFHREHGQEGAAIIFMPHTGGDLEWTKANGTPSRLSKDESQRGRYSSGVTMFASYLERTLKQRVSVYHGQMEDQAESASTSEGSEEDKPLGDLSGRTRRGEQERFIRGETNIMVCTKGFGMGIDKPNIRLVIHRTPTANLEAYAQEAGRAGRDGKRANVVLLYSPDAPNEDGYQIQSDHEIQTFFIENRYLRRQDVVALNAFLRGLSEYAPGRRYFTCTQVIRYFDALEKSSDYRWVSFPPPRLQGNFSAEHRLLRERGELYKNKQAYIERMLAVLFRMRPHIPQLGKEIAYIEEMQNVNTRPVVREIHPDLILQSNYYFGKKLREVGFTQPDFDLLGSETLVPFANRLGVSLAEANQIFNDIRQAEGYIDQKSRRWHGTLLDGWLETPTELPDWRQWREYAGAIARAKPPQDVTNPTLDHWFPKNTLPIPKAWDIATGEGFRSELFETFLEHFMALHDERRQNDWDAYYRLLTEYVGVSPSGELLNSSGRQPCLRSVMLGYLKTYEVVVGGNCKACSRCVPDLNFDRYTDEERSAVIISMEEETQTLLERFETFAQQAPSEADLADLFERIAHEESQLRSVRAYVSAWSARLLQDTLGHRGALWVRTMGVFHDFALDSAEIQRNLEQLIAAPTNAEEVTRLQALVERLHKAGYLEVVLYIWFSARLAEHAQQFEAAVRYYTQLYKQRGSNLFVEACRALFRLCAPNGNLPDAKRYRSAAYELALLVTKPEEMLTYFTAYSRELSLEALRKVLNNRRFDEAHRHALCLAWLLQQTVDQATLEAIEAQVPALWTWLGDSLPARLHQLAETPESVLGRRAVYELALRSTALDELIAFYRVICPQLSWADLVNLGADRRLTADHRMAVCWAWLEAQPVTADLLEVFTATFPAFWAWMGNRMPQALWEFVERLDLETALEAKTCVKPIARALSDDKLSVYLQRWHQWLIAHPEPRNALLTLNAQLEDFCNRLSPSDAASLVRLNGLMYFIEHYRTLNIMWHVLPSHKPLSAEIMLYARSLGYQPNPKYIADFLFNAPEVTVYFAQPLEVRIAEEILPFLQPADAFGWIAWFAYFPATHFTGEREAIGVDLLGRAAQSLLTVGDAVRLERVYTQLAEQFKALPHFVPLYDFGMKLLDLRKRLTLSWIENAETLRVVYKAFEPEESVSGAYGAAIVFDLLWQAVPNKNWLTPLKYLVQAYAWSGDFETAERFADSDYRLVFNKYYNAEEYIGFVRRALKGSHADRSFEAIFRHMAEMWVRRDDPIPL